MGRTPDHCVFNKYDYLYYGNILYFKKHSPLAGAPDKPNLRRIANVQMTRLILNHGNKPRKLFNKSRDLGLQAAKSLSIIRLLADAATQQQAGAAKNSQ